MTPLDFDAYPNWICRPCGEKHGRRKPGQATTWHEGRCDVCGEIATVTEPRDFGHLQYLSPSEDKK